VAVLINLSFLFFCPVGSSQRSGQIQGDMSEAHSGVGAILDANLRLECFCLWLVLYAGAAIQMIDVFG
tara:strand:- start:664 stop:867 length:204 start_codon:yes stop_codon:yes gene_type:complete